MRATRRGGAWLFLCKKAGYVKRKIRDRRSAIAVGAGRGQLVAPFVVGVAGVTLDPNEFYLMACQLIEQSTPQIGIERRRLVALDPTATPPGFRPALGDTVH